MTTPDTPEAIDDDIRIDITHADGILSLDPNGLVGACFTLDPLTSLKPLEVKSDISGEPALRYATCEITLYLTVEEIISLTFHKLSPEAYTALRKKHGLFFEIEDDFYDRLTGEALQPYM